MSAAADAIKLFSLKKAAEQGDQDSQRELGSFYLNGEGVTKDQAEAARWFRLAAEQGDLDSQRTLGSLYFLAKGVPKDRAEAARWYRLAAEQGDVLAQASLGDMYNIGDEGVTEDPAEAVRWYLLAAEQGERDAQLCLGEHYSQGKGVIEDQTEAIRWYRLAADEKLRTLPTTTKWPVPLPPTRANARAQYRLGFAYSTGQGVTEDHGEAVRWYRLAAEQGDEWGQFRLSMAYLFGEGVTEDPAEAIRWLRLAAEQGHELGQLVLGTLYQMGEGVTKDQAEAARWFRLAAEQGDANAQFNLGYMYHSGEGVTEDKAQALRWYRLAADQGDDKAQCNLGIMYQYGEGVTEDKAHALHWYRLAADQGYATAQFNLGEMYDNGEGVTEDKAHALHWYRLAADQGYASAQSALITSIDAKISGNSKEIQHERIGPNVISNPDYWEQQLDHLMQGMQNSIGPKDIELIFKKRLGNIFSKSISDIIKIDENDEIEFKESYYINTHTRKKDPEISFVALSEICGFLNTRDGILLIGVIDKKNRQDKNSIIAGLMQDGFTGDEDKYCRGITDSVRSHMSITAASLVKVSIEEFGGDQICRVECRKSKTMVFLKKPGKKEHPQPYVRYGSSTSVLPAPDISRWAEQRDLAL